MVSLPLSKAKVWQAAAAGAMQREKVITCFKYPTDEATFPGFVDDGKGTPAALNAVWRSWAS
jgi:hypothetical protein